MKPQDSFVSQPIRSLQTMLQVIAKADASLPDVIPDGIYGPATIRAITAFQRKHGLPQTGVTNLATWTKVAEMHAAALIAVGKAAPIEIILEPNAVFRLGDSSPYLFLLQSMLTVLSIDHDNIPAPSHCGMLDAETAESVAAFQALAGLPDTGDVDRITWKHISHQFTLAANRQSRFL